MNGMKILVLVLFTAIYVNDAIAAEGYEVLFKDVPSKLTQEEKKQIFEQLEFRLSDGKFYVNDCDRDVFSKVEVVDLNDDGIEEVFVYWGNLCTSGNAGSSISLFIKDTSGHYVMNLGFPAAPCYRILTTKNQGFPDLEFGGPGFCRGRWKWNGDKYEFKCSIEEEPGGCTRRGVDTRDLCKEQ